MDLPLETIQAAAAGDQDAARDIVETLHRPILAVMHRFLGRRFSSEVEDIAQDIFLKVFRAIDRFDPDRGVKFSTWIFSFVRNHCFDVLKKRRIPTVSLSGGAQSDGEDETTWELADPATRRPAERALDGELGARIEEALQSLSENHRMVFVLREFEQMDLKSIAEVMDCSEGTIKSRLHRAKEALKRLLSPYLEPS